MLAFAFALALAASNVPAAAPHAYHVISTVPLGGDGGWDYLTIDEVAHRLYISRSTHVMVVDSDSLKPIGDLPNTPGVHGVALVRELGRGFTSNGRDTSVTVFDLATLKPIQRVVVGERPDAIVYDPASRCVFTLNASGSATAVDAATGTVRGTVPFGTKPEAAVCDGHGRMFVNLEDSSAVAVVDTKTMKEVARWPLAPGEGPAGLAFDVAHGRLFSGCSNKTMVVLDATNGKVVATLPIGSRSDGVGFDPALGLACSTNGEGTLTVVHEKSPGAFEVLADVPTAMGARTVAVDPITHRVYTVTAEFGPAPAPTAEQPHPRPTMVPGSFKLVVLGQ